MACSLAFSLDWTFFLRVFIVIFDHYVVCFGLPLLEDHRLSNQHFMKWIRDLLAWCWVGSLLFWGFWGLHQTWKALLNCLGPLIDPELHLIGGSNICLLFKLSFYRTFPFFIANLDLLFGLLIFLDHFGVASIYNTKLYLVEVLYN